jgi:site-specific DNA-cytosine methylase
VAKRTRSIAIVLNPDAIVIENVPELLTTKYWPFIEESRKMLSAAGYSTCVGVHNMAEFRRTAGTVPSRRAGDSR